MDRERGDLYPQLTEPGGWRFPNIGGLEHLCGIAGAAVGDGQTHPVDHAASASAMKPATATGWAMKAVCEPAMDMVVAPMRSAMNRSASGGMALSCSETRYHDGLAFQPAAVAFSVRAATESGRCVANMTSTISTGTSAQKGSRKRSLAM